MVYCPWRSSNLVEESIVEEILEVGKKVKEVKSMGFEERRRGPRNDFGPREMHKAICSDCGEECEVPFKPAEGRPVYCRDCYQKHRKY